MDLTSNAEAAGSRSRHLRGAALVLALHFTIISLLVQSLETPISMAPAQQEILLNFRPVVKPKLEPRIKKSAKGPTHAQRPSISFPTHAPPAALGAAPSASDSLNLSLFGCAPENLSNLTEEERAHCSEAPNAASLESSIPGSTPERAVQAGRWASSSAREHAPMRVPCVGLGQTAGGGPGRSATVGMVDFTCLYRQWQNDFEAPEGR
jgi:hypothetical protein